MIGIGVGMEKDQDFHYDPRPTRIDKHNKATIAIKLLLLWVAVRLLSGGTVNSYVSTRNLVVKAKKRENENLHCQ